MNLRSLLLIGIAIVSSLGAILLVAPGRLPMGGWDAPLTPQQVYARASRSVVMVYAADAERKIVGRGSGVLVHPELVATNCHVIARAMLIRVRHEVRHWNGRLVAYDTERDLCMVAVSGLDLPPAVLAGTSALQVGERVYTLGTPEGFELTFAEGIVSGLRRSEGGRYIQMTAPVSEGSSGGGLFDSRARLVGITSFVYSAGQNLNFAAPADWVVELVDRVTRAPGEEPARTVELPPGYATQWRHPVLR
jgi:serine protease Do